MTGRLIACAVGALSWVAVASPAAAAVFLTAGASTTCAGSCFTDGNTYKVTWTAEQLAGLPGVQGLRLDRKVLGDMQNYTFKITFENAKGQTVGDWGSYMIAVLAGDTVQLVGPGFNWDSSMGDLVLKLSLSVPGADGVGGGFGGGGFGGGGLAAPAFVSSAGPGGDLIDPFVDTSGDGMASAEDASSSDDAGAGTADLDMPGLIDEMLPRPGGASAGLVSVAPEPQSWGLMMVGFGVAGGVMRKRRKAQLG